MVLPLYAFFPFKFHSILQLTGYFTSVVIPLVYGTVVSTEPDVSIMKQWLHGHKSLQLILPFFFPVQLT